MAYKIIQKEQDLAKKWRYLIDDGNGNVQMLKFDEEQKDDVVIAKAKVIQDKLKNEKTDITAEIAKVDEQIAELNAKKIELNAKISEAEINKK